MGMTIAMAGRFNISNLVEAVHEAAILAHDRTFAGWGISYCYGTLLETVKQAAKKPGELDFGPVSEIKTDMALVHLTEAGPGPFPAGRDQQPFARREPERNWAFCSDGTVADPAKLKTGKRVAGGAGSAERLFLHALLAVDVDDPVESTRRMYSELDDAGDAGMFLLCNEVLVAGAWDGAADEGAPANLWLGRGELMRVLAPMPLRTPEQFRWEQVPNRTVLALTRFRHEAG